MIFILQISLGPVGCARRPGYAIAGERLTEGHLEIAVRVFDRRGKATAVLKAGNSYDIRDRIEPALKVAAEYLGWFLRTSANLKTGSAVMEQGKVLTRVDGCVFRITINRPDRRNAIDPETNRLMHEAFERFAADPDLWIAVIRGAGDVAFSAGGDLKAIDSSLAGGDAYAIPETGYGGLTSRFDLIKPVIAAVNGLAFGGGFEIALAADLIVAADHARFALPEPRAGIYASAGGIHRVVRQLPKKVAMEFLLTGHRMEARRALELGLVNDVVPIGELDAAVDRMIERILQSAPLALRATKQMAEMGLNLTLEEAILAQDNGHYPALAQLVGSKDVKEGVRAFAEKRPPVWTAT